MSCSSLNNLINELKRKIRGKSPDITCIKHPVRLVKSLQKLNNVIGMGKLKESIARQTRYLIAKLQEGKSTMKMLNTILYGPPGVGKTKVGVIMAEIWANLGFLEAIAGDKSNLGITINNFNKYVSSDPEGLQILFFLLVFIIGYLFAMLKWCYNKFGIVTLAVLIGLAVVLAFFIWAYNYMKNYSDSEESSTIEITEGGDAPTTTSDDDIITITSRSDFVGQYVGWTAKKTEALLEANRGKVLFIDEAYSLLNSHRDEFGLEALTSINKWMSEHPDETVIIFAGYEEKMKQGIFTAQPGLPRRCMWHFNCDTYNGDELTKIFELQLEKEDLAIDPNDQHKVRRVINENVEAFSSYGGDTERLVFFVQLNQATRENRVPGLISVDDVIAGIEELRDNNIKNHNNGSTEEFNNYSQIMNDIAAHIAA